MRWVLGFSLLMGCIPSGTVKQPYDCLPKPLEDGWALSTPQAEGLDPDAVEALCRELFREDDHLNVLTLTVVANGAIVAEAAFRDPADRERVHHVQSISKSITSLVVGAAVDQGVLAGVDTPVEQWLGDAFPAGESEKRTMTVEHLLTMTGGLDVSNARFGIQVLMRGKDDSVAWLLEQPLYAPPGEEMYYRDADPHLLAAVIEAAAAEPFERFAQRVLFEPLGIEGAHIEQSPDGVAIAAAGVWMRPRDLARIGQLALNRGEWDGSPVVSADWIAVSTRTHQTPPEEVFEPFGYGYYWWTLPESAAFTAAGHGGQYVTVFPEDDVVVVLTATPYAATEVAIPLWDWWPMVSSLVSGSE